MSPKLKEALTNILDTCTGADGGTSYVCFLAMLEQLEKQPDDASKQILSVVYQFSKLLTVASKAHNPTPKPPSLNPKQTKNRGKSNPPNSST